MAVYKGEAYLAEAIESALRQTYSNFELVIVDDCSPDQSASVVERYVADGRIIYVRNEKNVGVAASRNRALTLAQGAYITFLDQDDVWLPRKLEIQLAAIKAHPEVGLLHAGYARIDSTGVLLPAYRQLPANKFANPTASINVRDVFAEIFISNDIQPLTTMIPREVIDATGPFDPELPGVDDYELWLRIALQYPVGHIETIVGYWRAHPAQQSNQGYKMLMIRLKAIDLILRRFPEASNRVPRRAFRKRMHSMCRSAANHTMYNLQDFASARDLFFRSVRYRVFDLPSWGKIFYCALPTRLRNTLRWAKRLLTPSAAGNSH
ncbi:MAG: glycosyltransferase [Burkholderiales bacterium]|nr:glycosyltransferase [Burkholderiales bacterium]